MPEVTQYYNPTHSCRFISLRSYKHRTFTSHQWAHPVRQTQSWICLWMSTVTGNAYHCTGLDCVTAYYG